MSSAPPIPPKRADLVNLTACKAATDYTATSPTELSCKEGDVIYIMSDKGDNWKCRNGKVEGTIPRGVISEWSTLDLPLHEAAKRGNLPWLKELMMTGISVNTLDVAGNSALYWACRGGHLDCVKVLLAARPTLHQQNKLGDTVLHGAAWGGHAGVVALLLDSPQVTDIIHLKNKSDKSAYEVARNVECAALLEPVRYAANMPTSLEQLVTEQQQQEQGYESD